MKTTITKPLPTVQRGRPIDATGLFWSFVCVLFGLFHIGMGSFVFGSVFLVVAVFGIVWQFRIWSWDSAINHQAAEWCQIHYPDFGDTPIVDMMVALSHVLEIKFATLAPSSSLVDLISFPDGASDSDFISLPEMLQCVVYEARIRKLDCSSFAGLTLDDAIKFVVESDAQRNTRKISRNQ